MHPFSLPQYHPMSNKMTLRLIVEQNAQRLCFVFSCKCAIKRVIIIICTIEIETTQIVSAIFCTKISCWSLICTYIRKGVSHLISICTHFSGTARPRRMINLRTSTLVFLITLLLSRPVNVDGIHVYVICICYMFTFMTLSDPGGGAHLGPLTAADLWFFMPQMLIFLNFFFARD